MPLILAVEPDRHQASQLQAIARGRLHAELVLEATAERALAALGNRIPDLILTAALLSPKDEAALAERLRALDSAGAHIHTLTIPVLAAPRSRPRMGGVLSALRREKSQAAEPDGCDPDVFAEQCATYLDRVVAGRKDLALAASYDEPALDPAPVDLVEAAFEPPLPTEEPQVSFNLAAANAAHDTRSFLEETFGDAAVEQTAEEPIARHSDEKAVDDVIEDPPVEELLDELSMEAPIEAAAFFEEPLEEPAAEQPLDDLAEEPVDPPALMAVARPMHDDDAILEESPLFELVTEAESESAPGSPQDLDRYIELDLSEFLDQSTSMLHAVVASGDETQTPAEADAMPVAAGDPAGAGAARDGGQLAASNPDPAAAEPDEADWQDVVEALRRDVERLDAAPVASPRPSRPLKKAPRKPLKGKPVQDEWGFFDPEQCGFAALLAKLDEVAKTGPTRRQK
jgi:CheY-like chemotaxis protein